MWAARVCLSLAAVAAVALGPGPALEPEAARAEGPPTSAARIIAIYQVKLGNFNLGNFRVTAALDGSGYQMRGEGKFSILEGLVYKWQGVTASTGQVTEAGPEPAMYSFSYTDGGKTDERLRMTFDDGAVQQVSIVPRKRAIPGTIPVKREQLEGVLDPMSGAFLTARSANPHGDLSVCNQLLPVFDGRSRFDLVLKPKKRVLVQNQSATTYSGPAAVCRVKFIPISGYQPDNAGIQMMTQSEEIEVWLIPVKGTEMYVPYRIVLPTPVGYGTAVVTSIQVAGSRRASID
jgi:Protein of unknown function (DUF3108)